MVTFTYKYIEGVCQKVETAQKSSETKWYYALDGNKIGPVNEPEIFKLIEEGTIKPDTLLWSYETENWTPAIQVERFERMISEPPPLPTDIQDPPDLPLVDEECSQVRPWVRYLARMFDIIVSSLIFGAILGVVFPATLEWPDAALNILCLFAWMIVESILLSTWGNTPGKWLMKTTVRSVFGRKLTFKESLFRSIQVFALGLGLGFPIFSFIAVIYSFVQLKNNRITSWDIQNQVIVSHKKIGVIRVSITILMVISLLFSIAYLNQI